MNLIKINKQFDINQDFWELNPQVSLLEPFNKIYPLDNSSEIMWCIFFMCDADESVNKLYRLKVEERKRTIKDNYFDIDFEDELIEEAISSYPFVCMNTVERALKEEKDSLVRRAELLRTTEYTLDKSMLVGDKAVVMKGTALQIDSMRSKTLKIYEDLERVIEKFNVSKSEEARVYGGRKETPSEKGLI